MMFVLSATAGRTGLRNHEEEEEVTYLAMEDGVEEEVTTMAVDSGTMFELGEDSQTVEAENAKSEEGVDAKVTHLLEIRTKLKFVHRDLEGHPRRGTLGEPELDTQFELEPRKKIEADSLQHLCLCAR